MIANYSFSSIAQQYPTLVGLLDDRAQKQADKTAYIFLENGETESATLTYKQLQQQAKAIAAHLQQKLIPGDRALLLYPSGLEFVTAFFGCLSCGVIAVPAYPPRRNQNLDRLQSIISDCQAKIALTTQALLPNLESRLKEDSTLALVECLATDSIGTDIATAWTQPELKGEDLAFLQYTSGSTGKPKGVMVSHSNLIANLDYIKQSFELTVESVSVTWLPSFHDMGLIDGVLEPVFTGFLGVMMPPVAFLQKPLRWLQAISNYGATHCGGPNFGYEISLKKVKPEEMSLLDLSRWTSAYNGAEPIRGNTLKRFSETFQICGFQPHFFYPCYGMAETTLMISGGRLEDEPLYLNVEAENLEQGHIIETTKNDPTVRQLVGCGHTRLDTDVIIVDPQTYEQCSTGSVGEIWVSGSSITQGYWNQPAKTAEIFNAKLKTGEGPFLRTGDLGFLQEDRELFVTGRLKDIIIIRGRNHYPQDIELTTQNSHEAFISNHSAAFCVEIEGEDKLVIVAEVERRYRHRPRPQETPEQFRQRQQQILERRKENINPGFEVNLENPPIFTEIMANVRKSVSRNHGLQVHTLCLLRFGSIPKTSSGKIQRHACRQGFLENRLNVVWRSP